MFLGTSSAFIAAAMEAEMSRSELIRAASARGCVAPPYTVEYMAQAGRFDPPPRLDGSHRRVFDAVHVDQLIAYVRRPRRSTGSSS